MVLKDEPYTVSVSDITLRSLPAVGCVGCSIEGTFIIL
jgi:hypothetical protein